MQIDLTGYSQITERFFYNRFIRLGTGAFGSVFKGYDNQYKRFIAVKQIPRSNLFGVTGELKQVEIMNKLKHKNIMDFYGSYGDKTNPEGIFMFLQLCQKGTLSNQIANKLTERRAYQLFSQLVEGMAYMHEKGIYHRDLKPENLLITLNDQLKIADFGIAKEESSSATFKKCTPVYSAPEVYIQQIFDSNNQTYNLKCDVFSAGYILYELLTSQQLNKGVKTAEDLRKFLVNSKNRGGFKIQHPALTQKHWIDLLKNMLCFDPSKRPTFKDIRNSLKKFLPGVDKLPQMRPQSIDQVKKSQIFVKEIKKFLTSIQKRNNYLVGILKIFSKYQQKHSNLIPSVYKLIILYLSLARYCCLSQYGLKAISDKENLQIPNTKLSLSQIEEELILNDKVYVNNFIKNLVSRANQGIEQMKVFVSNNIISQILKILRKDENNLQKKVIKEFNIQNGLKGFKLNEFEIDSFYQKGIKKCINNLYQTTGQLLVLSDQDLRIYLVSLYVANLDKYFNQANYETSTLPPSVQQILTMNRSQLQKAISQQKNKD